MVNYLLFKYYGDIKIITVVMQVNEEEYKVMFEQM
jgi:hypothetical protein